MDSKKQYIQLQEKGLKTGGRRQIQIKAKKGTFKVWTQQIGNNPDIKVLLLHGGPGSNHLYFHCFESFFPEQGIQFFYYDQLGSFNSDQPEGEEFEYLWELERYVDEVEQVRVALGLDSSNFYLYGHSWGGLLALEYAVKYQYNLKALLISNMNSNCQVYEKYVKETIGPQMPEKIYKELMEYDKNEDFENPRYFQLLLDHFYPKHFGRLKELPWSYNQSIKYSNSHVYTKLNGPSEFGVKGSLKTWNRDKDLPNIKVPLLAITGKYDTMDPENMEFMSKQVQKGRFVNCPEGSHMAMWDDQEYYFKNLIQFIFDVHENKI